LREKEDFCPKVSSSVGIELVKRMDSFIKNYITRYVDSSFRNIYALKPLMHVAISQEDTLFRAELQFVEVVRP
jgi:hypothetical protein